MSPHMVAYANSYTGPFSSREAAASYAAQREPARPVTRSRRFHLLRGPAGQVASQSVDRRGLGDWRDQWPIEITVSPPRSKPAGTRWSVR